MFQKGDTVAFIDEEGTATVLAVNGDKVKLLTGEGFEATYPVQTLILRKSFEVDEAPQKDAPTVNTSKKEKVNTPNLLEVDLHFHELVDYPKNFSNFEMLQIQLREARAVIDKARREGIKKVILIHGVGEGRLREEIHTMLERMDRLQFFDASYARYGQGATEVELY